MTHGDAFHGRRLDAGGGSTKYMSYMLHTLSPLSITNSAMNGLKYVKYMGKGLRYS